jgi:hypothetical protein
MKPSVDFYRSLSITKHKRYRPIHTSRVRLRIPEYQGNHATTVYDQLLIT